MCLGLVVSLLAHARVLPLAVGSHARVPPPLAVVSAPAADETRLILAELKLQCCIARLENHHLLMQPRLALRALPAKIEVEELQSMTQILSNTLDRQEPFSVLWDLRNFRPPSRAALRFGIDWMGEHAQAIDELVTSTIIINRQPLVRSVCSFILRVCNPPRPVVIVGDDAAALEAVRKLELESMNLQ